MIVLVAYRTDETVEIAGIFFLATARKKQTERMARKTREAPERAAVT